MPSEPPWSSSTTRPVVEVRASRLIIFGLIATAGTLVARPAGADDIVIGDETTPLKAAVCLDVPLVPDLHLGIGLGVPEPCARAVGDGTTPLPPGVCVDVPLVSDLHVGVGVGGPEPCPRALGDAAPPPAPVPAPPPAPLPAPSAAVSKPEVRAVAAPRAVEAAPIAEPPIVEPTEPAPLRTIQSHRPSAPTPPPNPFGSTVALVVVAAAVAGGTNILFRSSTRRP